MALGLMSGCFLYAQTETITTDTLKTGIQGQQEEMKENGSAANKGKQVQAGRGNNSGNVKKIRSGRPDMSKARGARPPSVVRPSGPSIPKGVGKPGGVGRKGGR